MQLIRRFTAQTTPSHIVNSLFRLRISRMLELIPDFTMRVNTGVFRKTLLELLGDGSLFP
mgnify:CR=1 FL=1